MSKWKGTPVPNSGYVEKVYVNTALSVEEVLSIINDNNLFTSTVFGEAYMVVSLYETGNDKQIGVQKVGDAIAIVLQGAPVFISQDNFNLGFTGWQPDFSGVFEFNDNASDSYHIGSSGDMTVGLENDKLSSLFSVTPFVLEEDKPADQPKRDWLRELFINEAKPALQRHSGSGKSSKVKITDQETGEEVILEGDTVGTDLKEYIDNEEVSVTVEITT